MAIKIIFNPKDVAVKFKCPCGCEFYADNRDMKLISVNAVSMWSAKCPNCKNEVTSKDTPVPSSEVFNMFDRFSNWVEEREKKQEDIKKLEREIEYESSRRRYGY